MARRRRTLASLEGKLGEFRRDALKFRRNALKVLGGLRDEIGRRERELASLKTEYAKTAELLPERLKVASPATRGRPRRRARQIDWKQVFASLPARFTLNTLIRHKVAGKRSRPHLYAILSRWKKERLLSADPAGGYRKVEAKPTKKRAPRPKPVSRPDAPAE